MKKAAGQSAGKDAQPAATAGAEEEQEPEVPQDGFGKFEYIN